MDCAYTFQLNTDTIILDGIFLCLRCSSYSELGSRFAVDTPSAVVLHSVAYNISLTTIYVDARSLLITFNGVADDFRIGVRIEQRNAIAQKDLSVMYAFGKGVPKDYVYAHMWGSLAATNGDGLGGMLRDDYERKMTPADISAAKKLARECVRKNYKGC